GICIEVCPFDALFWSPEFEYAESDIRDLLHEKDKLASWVPTVPPPPAHDPGAEPPKELTAAPRRPARAGGPSAAARGAGSGPARAGRGEGPSAAAPAAERRRSSRTNEQAAPPQTRAPRTSGTTAPPEPGTTASPESGTAAAARTGASPA